MPLAERTLEWGAYLYDHIPHSDVTRLTILFSKMLLKPCCSYSDSVQVKVKVNQSRYRPGVAQRVPGS